MDKYIILKLMNGEEIIGTYLAQDDNSISVMFPMKVKYIPTRTQSGKLMESISLAPYTYFAADDEFTFLKNHIIFMKDLNPSHLDSYHIAVDDFVGTSGYSTQPEPSNVEELKQLADKLQNMFKDRVKEEEIEESIFINTDSKLIH